MEYAQKYRWALAGMLVLLVLNIATLVTIWMIRPPLPGSGPEDDPPRRVQRFLRRELDLSADQQRTYQQLRSRHMAQTRSMVSELEESREAYFDLLHQPETPRNEAKRDSLALRIGNIHAKLEESAYNHFKEMRNMLDEEQKQKFDSVIEQSLRRRGSGMRQSGNIRRSDPGPGSGPGGRP